MTPNWDDAIDFVVCAAALVVLLALFGGAP